MAEYKKFSTLENCLLELLLNSLHSEATAIAVRFDNDEKRFMVIDNGCGISKNDLFLLGESTKEHKNFIISKTSEKINSRSRKSFSQIRNVSSVLVIMSKERDSLNTYGKFFKEDRVPELKKLENRPSCGTTVTVYASTKFFQSNDEIDSFTIRYIIGYLAFVNTQVSFSVRDDRSQSIVLRIGKNQKRRKLLRILCERSLLTNGRVSRIKGTISDRINIEIYWGIECTSNKINEIFLNLRPVNCPALQKLLIKILTNIRSPEQHDDWKKIFFLFYIQSPETEYELTSKEDATIAEFYEMPGIIRAIEKMFATRRFTRQESSHRAINSSLIFRPICRINGSEKKRSFFTNLPRQYFSNKSNVKKIHFNKNESVWRQCLANFIKKQNYEVTEIVAKKKDNNEDFGFDSWTSDTNAESNLSENNESRTSRTTLPKTAINLNESSPIFDDFNRENISSETINNFEKSGDQNLSISQNKNRPVNFTVLNKSYRNHDISWISQRCAEKSQKNVRTSQMEVGKTPEIIQANIEMEDLSTWSNWTYHSQKKTERTIPPDKPIIYKRFKFLPVHLHALLPHGKIKLTDRDPVEAVQLPPNFHLNLRRQDHEVRACTKRNFEFRLKLQSLKSMKVLSQVNREFIVASTKQDDKKLLLIIDQHAMHERIRYENLLKAYKGHSGNQQFVSNVLRRPIIISDFSSRDCQLLWTSRKLLAQFGLNLSKRNENTLSIHTVPRCFSKRSFDCDNTRLEISVRKLLQEVVEDLDSGGSKLLPFTIHDAIASEACHGSIKFGDPLTPEQCDVLVSCWKDTDTPNRCAHGRPSVIPLLELSTYKENGIDSKFKVREQQRNE